MHLVSYCDTALVGFSIEKQLMIYLYYLSRHPVSIAVYCLVSRVLVMTAECNDRLLFNYQLPPLY